MNKNSLIAVLGIAVVVLLVAVAFLLGKETGKGPVPQPPESTPQSSPSDEVQPVEQSVEAESNQPEEKTLSTASPEPNPAATEPEQPAAKDEAFLRSPRTSQATGTLPPSCP